MEWLIWLFVWTDSSSYFELDATADSDKTPLFGLDIFWFTDRLKWCYTNFISIQPIVEPILKLKKALRTPFEHLNQIRAVNFHVNSLLYIKNSIANESNKT